MPAAVRGEVALVSFDDYEWMRVSSPAITAVGQPIEAMADTVWQRLRSRIGGDTSPPREFRLACSFEVRASSGRRPGTAPSVARPSSDGIVRSTSGRTNMAITRRSALTLATGIIAAGTLPGLTRYAIAQDKPEIVTVVKIGGIPWFNAMEVGIKKEGEALGVDASMIGPTQADAAQQVRAVEDLIARKVDVIAVVPNDATALEPVFKRAQEAGIKVLTHESPDQKFNDWNVELTTVDGFGETHMEALAKAMGGEGKYIVYVGSLTVPLHNKWADAAIALQKEKYPKMELVADRFGVAESLDDSYKTALDQMRANPDLKGILAFGSQGPIGAARAVEERGKEESVAVVGPFSPGQGAKYIKSGAIREGFIWNPMQAGETIVYIGNMLAKGETPTDGMELPGLGKVSVDPETRNILAQKLQPINKDTIDELVGMGL
jgi:simple sugar transport system substrate-binding protein